jgi:hypothetical protein
MKSGVEKLKTIFRKCSYTTNPSPNINMVESVKIRWAGYVQRMEDVTNLHIILVKTPEGTILFETGGVLGEDGSIILKYMLK